MWHKLFSCNVRIPLCSEGWDKLFHLQFFVESIIFSYTSFSASSRSARARRLTVSWRSRGYARK